MPKSRNRGKGKKANKGVFSRQDTLQSFSPKDFLREILSELFPLPIAPTYYHYTTWKGAEGILKSNRLRATAHDCTNDPAELLTADEAIMDAANDVRESSAGYVRASLDRFVAGYPDTRISNALPIYLTCFSFARDDSNQWELYADHGQGGCLGICTLNEPAVRDPVWTEMIVKVDYLEESWKGRLRGAFESFRSKHSPLNVPTTDRNIDTGVLLLNWVAAAFAMSVKRPEWQQEQEVRRIILVNEGATLNPEQRLNDSGQLVRYIDLPVRRQDRRIAFSEILIGPNQDQSDGRQKIVRILKDAGYEVTYPEYPAIQ
jgi:hypothetical protein